MVNVYIIWVFTSLRHHLMTKIQNWILPSCVSPILWSQFYFIYLKITFICLLVWGVCVQICLSAWATWSLRGQNTACWGQFYLLACELWGLNPGCLAANSTLLTELSHQHMVLALKHAKISWPPLVITSLHFMCGPANKFSNDFLLCDSDLSARLQEHCEQLHRNHAPDHQWHANPYRQLCKSR